MKICRLFKSWSIYNSYKYCQTIVELKLNVSNLKHLEVVLKIVVHVQGQGASRRKNAVRQSALADEYFKEACNMDIERKTHF